MCTDKREDNSLDLPVDGKPGLRQRAKTCFWANRILTNVNLLLAGQPFLSLVYSHFCGTVTTNAEKFAALFALCDVIQRPPLKMKLLPLRKSLYLFEYNVVRCGSAVAELCLET